ncbi:MAG TPA: O-antigen ligase family protein [Chloroflexia bacterium]|nr:O-antigen ligase family protein [Chloroflexia bacterium]
MARTIPYNSKLAGRLSRLQPVWVWFLALLAAAVAGAGPPLYVGAGLAAVLLLVLLLRKPVWGAYMLVLSVPVQKAVNLPADITVTQLLFVLVLGIWWAWLSIRRDRRLTLTPVAVALFFFLVSTFASLWNTTSMPESLAEISRWLVTILSYLIIVNSVQTRRQMTGLIIMMLVAGLSEALLGLGQAYSGIGPESFNVGGLLTRAYGTIGAPNSFAGYINMSLPLALALAIYQWGRWIALRQRTPLLERPDLVSWKHLRLPLFLSVVALVLFWTVLTTLSRGAWIGLTFGVLAMVVALGKRAAPAISVLVASGLAMLGLGSVGALPPTVSDRFGLLVSQLSVFDPRGITPTPENYAIVERMVHWQVAGNMFLSNPWFGVGIGNFNVLFNKFGVQGWPYSRGHAHNYYLHLLAETGIVGLTFYLVLLVTITAVAVRGLRRVRSAGDGYAEAVAIGALGIFVTFSFHNLFENLHALNMGIHWGAALALFTLAWSTRQTGSRQDEAQERAPYSADYPEKYLHTEVRPEWKS